MNLFVRLFVALNTNLIIDEAYYFTYAVAPGLSYFDHPPMVGQLILLTTLNLLYTGEIFLRLGPLVIGTINLLLIYLIGKELKDSKTGVLAMLMVSASAYHSIVAGTFILPDAPLSLFWLIAIFAAIKYIKSDRSVYIILFGVATGFAMLSKYHGVTLWFAMGLFILFRDRAMLRRPSVYLSAFLSLLLFMPVVIWYIDNQFIGAPVAGHSHRFIVYYAHFTPLERYCLLCPYPYFGSCCFRLRN
jgi:4-amino-4-deoxy-L-arabinose transferase-like glycosyltransferase